MFAFSDTLRFLSETGGTGAIKEASEAWTDGETLLMNLMV